MKTQTNQEQQEDSKAGFEQEVLKLDFNQLKDGLSGFVRGTVEEALNGLLQVEAEELCEAKRHESQQKGSVLEPAEGEASRRGQSSRRNILACEMGE